MSNNQLPADVQGKINKDALLARQQRAKDLHDKYEIEGYEEGYIAGATAEAERAQIEIGQLKLELKQKTKALERFVGMHETGLLPNRFVYDNAREILEQWKEGKDVELIKEEAKSALLDLGICKKCQSRPATTDYNGHGYYVCQPCDDSLNRGFDDEYH